MEGGEIMQFLSAIISAVIANVVGHYICKWLDRISLSGSWKTLHGVVKRSLIKTMIISINKKTSGQARLFWSKPCFITAIMVTIIIPSY